ncbi:hypothetical protein PINS_up000746 [Pythium insidiosum]|nr:hypothetical protein PINS_up000746 [Pythium insidiosum]
MSASVAAAAVVADAASQAPSQHRRSSVASSSSCTSELAEQSAAVAPLHDRAAIVMSNGSSPCGDAHAQQLQPQQNGGRASFSFEEIMSPRQANGKRFLSGYLQHRVSMAGGFLKSWKRRYFRLRDHGIVCYKSEQDTTPLFALHFRAQSVLLEDKPQFVAVGDALPPHAMSSPSSSSPASMMSSRGKANSGSWLFIVKFVDVEGHLIPANKVDLPLFLKAESEREFHDWVQQTRLKMDARKQQLALDAVEDVTHGAATATTAVSMSTTENRLSETQQLRRCSNPETNVERQATLGLDVHETTTVSIDSPRVAPSSDASGERRGSLDTLSPRGIPVEQSFTPTVSGASMLKLSDSKRRLLFSTPHKEGIAEPPEFASFRNKFLLLKEIGEGSFSIVHRGVNRLTAQLCAIKCCKHTPALDEEVAILRKLSHPNIIQLEGVYHQDEMFYVVMDYMGDGDLCEQLIRKQRLTESEAKRIILQVVCALEYLHRHFIMHRDIKPENILLHGGLAKLADFGLAKQLPNATSMLKRSCGTLEYAAPELLRGQAYGLKSDIFSLGVVLYVLLFGTFPFSIESAAALQRMQRFPGGVDVRDMSCLRRDNAQWRQVSPAAQDVLLRMLCQDERDRISAKDLLHHSWFHSSTNEACGVSSPVTIVTDHSDVSSIDGWSVSSAELKRLDDCLSLGFVELLTRGFDVNKHGQSGTTSPHATTLLVDFVHGTMSWTRRSSVLGFGGTSSTNTRRVSDHPSPGPSQPSKRNSRMISFSDILEVRHGHTTNAFSIQPGSNKVLPPPELCVSVVSSWRTLDIAVKSPYQAQFFLVGMTRALQEYRAKHKSVTTPKKPMDSGHVVISHESVSQPQDVEP